MNSIRRVLFIVPSLGGGGAERVMTTILRHLDRNHFHPALAIVDKRENPLLPDAPGDIEVIDLQCKRVRFAFLKLIRLIRARRPDVVFSTLGYLNIALALVRPLLPNKTRYLARETIVLSAHFNVTPGSWIWRAAYKLLYKRFDAIICQSEDMRKDLVQHFGLPSQKTRVIHNPVDVARIQHQARSAATTLCADPAVLRILSAGRLAYQKGFDILIDAVALCRRPVEVTILGDGDLRPQLEQRAAAKGVADRIRFAGFQSNPYSYMAQADVFVLSSRYEGFPNVVLEAMACGTPVVALPVPGGVEEILRDVEGCIIAKEATPESLSEAISSFTPGARIDPEILKPYAAEVITRRYEQEFAST